MNNTSLIITQSDLDMFLDHLQSGGNLSAFNKTQLSEDLRSATIVSPGDVPNDVVTTDSFIKLLDLESMQEFSFYLVPPARANIKTNKVSCLAPIGMALFGYRTGAEIKWEMPNGFRLYKLLSVTRAEKAVPELVNS